MVPFFETVYSVSQKNSPWGGPDFFGFFSQTVENF